MDYERIHAKSPLSSSRIALDPLNNAIKCVRTNETRFLESVRVHQYHNDDIGAIALPD
jgi:hypothetical protein